MTWSVTDIRLTYASIVHRPTWALKMKVKVHVYVVLVKHVYMKVLLLQRIA